MKNRKKNWPLVLHSYTKTVTKILYINSVYAGKATVADFRFVHITEQCEERIMFINVSTVRMCISYGVISTRRNSSFTICDK